MPPAFPKKEGGGSSAWNARGPAPGTPPHSLEPRAPQPGHAGAPEPLSASRSSLGQPPSSKSLAQGTRQPPPKECSNASLPSSGYTGDSENSDVSLVAGRQVAQLNKRSVRTQAGGQQSAARAPSLVKSP